MYEEEDDDLPMQYRRLTAHLQSQNVHLDRRLQAYVAHQVAMRTGGWTQGAFQGNDQNQFMGSQFMNPSFMQMQQPAYQQQSMMPPQQQQMHRMSSNYRQSPYPVSNQMAPQWQQRASPMGTPNYPSYQQQQPPQSAHPSPSEAAHAGSRRTSTQMPQAMPHTPQSQHAFQPAPSPQQLSPAMSRKDASSNAATPYNTGRPSQSPQQVPTPPQQPQQQQGKAFSSPFNADFEQQLQDRSNPLTMELPMESQQILGGSMAFDMNDPLSQMFMPSQIPNYHQSGMKQQQQPFYSYNPNGKPRSSGSNSNSNSQSGTEGLSQTLAPASLDTSVGATDGLLSNSNFTSQSASTDYLNTPFGLGLDGGFGMDPFTKAMNSGFSSGHATPDESWMNEILSEDFYGAQQTAA